MQRYVQAWMPNFMCGTACRTHSGTTLICRNHAKLTTSSLDSLTEEEITVTIRDVSVRKDLITILIAHRLSTVIHADRIYVLERGRIVESGRHEDLLSLKGLYYAMWRQQIGERSFRAPQYASGVRANA